MGNAATGDGLWPWDDVLAVPAGLAEKGVWQEVPKGLLAKLREADSIDGSRAVAERTSVRAVLGGANGAESNG